MEFKEIYGGYRVSKCGTILGKRGHAMSPSFNGRGYLIISLLTGEGRITKAVHRLVAEAWLENPNSLPEVNHKDCIRTNNHVDNLEWVTHGGNIEYSYLTGNRSAKGENNSRAKITEVTAIQICELLSQGYSAAEVRDMGFDYTIVRGIKRRKNWKYISDNYIW